MATAADNRKSGIATSTVVLCTLAVLIFVFALSLFLQGGFRAAQASEYETKVLTTANEAVEADAAEHRAILEEAPRWLDEEAERACIPIEDAMRRLVEEDAARAHDE